MNKTMFIFCCIKRKIISRDTRLHASGEHHHVEVVGADSGRGERLGVLLEFLLGGQRLPGWVIAISERASGESSWLLLGLTGAALTVAIATSNSFLIPTHQVNALIMGPGGYRVPDFMRAGGIMTVLFLVVMMAMMNLVF